MYTLSPLTATILPPILVGPSISKGGTWWSPSIYTFHRMSVCESRQPIPSASLIYWTRHQSMSKYRRQSLGIISSTFLFLSCLFGSNLGFWANQSLVPEQLDSVERQVKINIGWPFPEVKHYHCPNTSYKQDQIFFFFFSDA